MVIIIYCKKKVNQSSKNFKVSHYVYGIQNGDKWSKSVLVIKTVTFVKITATFLKIRVTFVCKNKGDKV